jgi:hypothetical protein
MSFSEISGERAHNEKSKSDINPGYKFRLRYGRTKLGQRHKQYCDSIGDTHRHGQRSPRQAQSGETMRVKLSVGWRAYRQVSSTISGRVRPEPGTAQIHYGATGRHTPFPRTQRQVTYTGWSSPPTYKREHHQCH